LPGVPILTAAQIGEIGALMVHGDDLVAAPPPGDSANDVATAIAVAIWSVEYGTTFTFNYVDSTVATLAPLYYSDAISGAWAPFVGYSALSYTNDQTLTSNQHTRALDLGNDAARPWRPRSRGVSDIAQGAFDRRLIG
jgi:hypothetical protein